MTLVVSNRLNVDATFACELGRCESFHVPSICPYLGTECKALIRRDYALWTDAERPLDIHRGMCRVAHFFRLMGAIDKNNTIAFKAWPHLRHH